VLPRDVPVLVVGAGPTGLVTSLLLERQGVPTLLLERRDAPQRAPAAHVVNARTFEVCRAAGVSVVGSCLEGVCGTCETEIIHGDVDHRDSILNDEEKESNEFMMICVSRCRSDTLTLDL
jgi:2-polyprenyl-6-methoxyphenol hydroxylase-like FAD-dependent oxidoreductase